MLKSPCHLLLPFATEPPSLIDQLGKTVLLNWFARRQRTPFAFQLDAWDAYLSGQSGLIHASTGTGKTYAAWLGPLLEWMVENPNEAGWGKLPPPPLRVLWITPLRALAADTEDALRAPLNEIGIPWTLEPRTGDTSSSIRNKQRTRLPTALITTPESLSLLLARPDAAALFKHLRAVIVDEWHELAASKRGVQTELALARLRHWSPTLRTWGLSATLGNLNTAMSVLLGAGATGHLIKADIPKTIHIRSIIPEAIERFPWAGHLGTRLLPEVIAQIEAGETALVFTNTRAQSELWYQTLLEAKPDWAGLIALHHSSIERKTREWVEAGLREGRLRCVVCTSSLDLGVDFSPVDSVIQVGSAKGIARLLQRAGRSGHQPGAVSQLVCVPTHAFELIEISAARDAIRDGRIEARLPYDRPLDVLVQHAVTIALGGGFRASDLFEEVRTTHAYHALTADEWAWVLDFITRGGEALQNYPEYARVTVADDGLYTIANPQAARQHRLSIGTIVSDQSMRVQYLSGGSLGHVEESFVSRLKAGDKFIFAGKIVQFVRVREMTAWVRRASGKTGIVPRWAGSRMAFSSELSEAVRATLQHAREGHFEDAEMQAVRPILAIQARWSHIPGSNDFLIERTKTRDGYHLFFFPFEGRPVHEGLAALFAYRIGQLTPISFNIAVNDYGFDLLSPDEAPLERAIEAGLFSTDNLLADIPASLNASEMARRQFREIARVSGLVFQGFPGHNKSGKQIQASSGLLYDVFARYDPANLLLEQAHREVFERQLERSRLWTTLERLERSARQIVNTPHVTPFAFPLIVETFRDSISSERLSDRIKRMQLQLERAADAPVKRPKTIKAALNSND